MEGLAGEKGIAAVAARQYGVVTAEQLRSAGFSRAQIKRRLRAGRLRRIHRNVYLVDSAAAPDGATEMAAMFACGDDSVVSHRSAGRLWKASLLAGWQGRVEISVPDRHAGQKAGLRIYRVRSLDRRDVRRLGEIRVTSPARTLLDLASVLPLHEVEEAIADVCGKGLASYQDLVQVLDRNPGRRGARAFRRLIELARSDGLTRSAAERKLKALLRTTGLPMPKSNAWLHGYQVDFLWREERVVVEVDGFAFHSGKKAFEQDRARDAMLHAHGYKVTRITWQRLVTRPEEVVALVAGALATGSLLRNRVESD